MWCVTCLVIIIAIIIIQLYLRALKMFKLELVIDYYLPVNTRCSRSRFLRSWAKNNIYLFIMCFTRHLCVLAILTYFGYFYSYPYYIIPCTLSFLFNVNQYNFPVANVEDPKIQVNTSRWCSTSHSIDSNEPFLRFQVNIFHKNGWCQLTHYLTYVCSFLSAWTVVGFTSERWVIVFQPLRRRRLCTRRRAALVMSLLTGVALVFYSFSIWTMGINRAGGMATCMSLVTHRHFLKAITSIDTIATVIVPVVLILAMNTAIAMKIYRYTNGRKREQHEVTLSASKNSTRSLSRWRLPDFRKSRLSIHRRHNQYNATRALLVVSTVFILLNLPSHAFRVQALVISIRDEPYEFDPSTFLWRELLTLLHYVSFSSNFFLYSACSRHFRYTLKRAAQRLQHKLQRLRRGGGQNWCISLRPGGGARIVQQNLAWANTSTDMGQRTLYRT